MTIGRTFKAVAWSFFGVRKGSDHERDVAELKPQQVIVVGIVCAALFVALLVVIVKWVIGSGVAAG
jgi:hypothetical protein